MPHNAALYEQDFYAWTQAQAAWLDAPHKKSGSEKNGLKLSPMLSLSMGGVPLGVIQ